MAQELKYLDDMLDPFEGLEGGSTLAEVVDEPEKLRTAAQATLVAPLREKFRGMEDAINERFLKTLDDASYARDIDAETGELIVPEDWEDLPPEEREKRKRVALDAHRNKKSAPVYLDLAVRVVTGLAKARASEKEVVERKLNVQVAVITVPMPQFEEIIVEREER